jgi:processive 1,2-diacylglycerol beta-glucosyltransferase
MKDMMLARDRFVSGRKKVLIFYTSVGLGHKYISQNIGWHLERAGLEVLLADIGQVQSGKFEKIVVAFHQFINKYFPKVWGWLYFYGHFLVLPFRVFIAGLNCKIAKKVIDEFQPDLIISSQTTSSAVVAYLKRKKLYKNKFAITFSDYHLHPYWLYKEADFYLANIEEQKQQMINQGISLEKIFVCGITLKPKVSVEVEKVKLKFGINLQNPTILVGAGSLGIGFNLDDLKRLLKIPDVNIIFVCGKNIQLYEYLKKLNLKNLIPFGFFEPMAELYSLANIFIGKPGGLSTAEALQYNLPLVVTFTLPGQEELNLKYLVEKKLVIAGFENLVERIIFELKTGEFRKQLLYNQYAKQIVSDSGFVARVIKANLDIK